MRRDLLITKFFTTDSLLLFSLFAFKSIAVMRKPLNTKNRFTPNGPVGIKNLSKMPPNEWVAKLGPQCSISTKNTANALNVSSPLMCFIEKLFCYKQISNTKMNTLAYRENLCCIVNTPFITT